jgi:hypothetical protein
VNLIEQLQTDVARHQRQLEERLAELKVEMVETRKVLTSVAKYRARLDKQHPNDEAALPLAPPDDEEEEATDEVDDADAEVDPNTGLPETKESIVPGEWSPGYEVPKESDEANTLTPEQISAASEKGLSPSEYSEGNGSKPIRRRKAKATAEE